MRRRDVPARGILFRTGREDVLPAEQARLAETRRLAQGTQDSMEGEETRHG